MVITAALGLLIYAVIGVPSAGWASGRTFGPLGAVAVGGVWFSQRLISRFGAAPVAALGTSLLAVACLLLSTVSLTIVIAGLVVFGTGMGGAFVAAQIAAFTGVADRDSGLAAGLIDTTFTMGSALGIAICSSVALTAGYRAAFMSAVLFAVFGLATAVILRRPADKPGELVVPAH